MSRELRCAIAVAPEKNQNWTGIAKGSRPRECGGGQHASASLRKRDIQNALNNGNSRASWATCSVRGEIDRNVNGAWFPHCKLPSPRRIEARINLEPHR